MVLRMRSLLCGVSLASSYVLASIATKTYYNLEMWLSLPGAILLFGLNSVIGYTDFNSIFSEIKFIAFNLNLFFFFQCKNRFIVMYNIMPETEQRSLEDIEFHYSDNTKGLTDIDIAKHLYVKPTTNE